MIGICIQHDYIVYFLSSKFFHGTSLSYNMAWILAMFVCRQKSCIERNVSQIYQKCFSHQQEGLNRYNFKNDHA